MYDTAPEEYVLLKDFSHYNDEQKKLSTNIENISKSRIIRKSGRMNVFLKKLPGHKHMSFISDLGNTLLTIQWRWIILTLCLVNFASYFIFGGLWMLLAHGNGDFRNTTIETDYCVINTKTFTGYLLLSIETITTIGYGHRYPTENCTNGWILLTSQAIFSIAIQGALVSSVMAKISKPFTTLSKSLFSKQAIICLRNGKFRFIFRIYDFTGKIWCNTKISLYFIYKNNHYEIQKMPIEPHGLLILPLEIEHVIDENSPLWQFDILQKSFEIVAVAEGSSMITGQISQNRTSYIGADIRRYHKFLPCVDFDKLKEKYVVQHKEFNKTARDQNITRNGT